MGNNKHTPYDDTTHPASAPDMNGPPSELDKSVTYLNDKLITGGGTVSWDSVDTLTWNAAIAIRFAREDGKTVENTIAASSKTIADGDFAYVDLNETTGTAITVSTATPTTNAASNFLADGRLVLGRRVGTNFYPVALLPILQAL